MYIRDSECHLFLEVRLSRYFIVWTCGVHVVHCVRSRVSWCGFPLSAVILWLTERLVWCGHVHENQDKNHNLEKINKVDNFLSLEGKNMREYLYH